MKHIVYLLTVLALALTQSACTDQCTETRVFRRFTPITFTQAQIRQGVGTEASRTLQDPGKIYTKDGFLFINEIKQGIHIIDNRNPESPRMVSFIRIPGNGDIAVRNNILYADSYMDLVAFDISDVTNVRALKRVNNVFPSGQFNGGNWWYNPNTGDVSDQRVEYVKEEVKTNCEEDVSPTWWGGMFLAADNRSFSSAQSAAPSTGGQTANGTAGSMARFALYDNYLYTVTSQEMQLFDIQNPADPKLGNKITLGWGIETIFPYGDKLFIGSQSGMHIYDNKNPQKPERLSVFQHARVCDPVVVHGDKAYVTLRSGNTCAGFTNQLDVVDISNLLSPKLIKSYPMRNPHGLGVDFPNLFICEGAYGLKSFNAKDAQNVELQEHIEKLDAYDVIPLGKSLLLIGKDGFYQYDYSNPRKLRLMSKIPVERPNAIS